MFVAEQDGELIGNLLGTVDVDLADQREETYTRRLRRRRLLLGAYGVPVWLIPLFRTDAHPSSQTLLTWTTSGTPQNSTSASGATGDVKESVPRS
jgi:hypothetical protein